MFTKTALQGYFNLVKNKIPQESLSNPDGFFYLPIEIYDPDLDFEQELKSYLVQNNQSLRLSERPWIAIVWNRGVLEFNQDGTNQRRAELLKRNITNPLEPTGTKDIYKSALCPFNIVYYSNSLDYLETFEEYMHLFLKDVTAYQVNFTNISSSPTSVAIKNFTVEDFTKESRENQGEIVRLSTSLELAYPIVLPDGLGVRKLIGQGKINITYKIILTSESFPISS